MSMMIHRHFDKQNEQNNNLTTLNDVAPKPQDDDELVDTVREDYQPRRGRRRKEE